MSDVIAIDSRVLQDGLPKAARLVAMTAIALAVLLSVLDYTVVNIAMPEIARDIRASDAASIWVINAYQLANVAALLPVASLGEKFGHARMCRIGLVIFVGASLLCAVSQNLGELAAARAVQGLGGACILGVNAALVRYIYPASLLGRGIALNGFIIAFGVALGPSVGAAVLSFASWRWLFLINLPFGAVALVFALSALPVTPRVAVKFQGASAALLAFGLAGIVIGGDSLVQDGSHLLGVALLVIGLLSMTLLVRLCLSNPHPLLPVDLLRRADFAIAFISGFLSFVASNFFIISMPFTLTLLLHRPPIETGLIITSWPAAIMLTAPFVGRLADRYPAAILSTIGLLIVSVGFLFLRLLPAHPGDFDIAWRIALAGAGFSLVQPPNNKAMLIAAPKHRLAGASGMISVSRLSGQTIGGMLVALTLTLARPYPTMTCLAFASLAAFIGAALSATRILANRPIRT